MLANLAQKLYDEGGTTRFDVNHFLIYKCIERCRRYGRGNRRKLEFLEVFCSEKNYIHFPRNNDVIRYGIGHHIRRKR
ncbi:hypothetical protein GCM10007199_42990 [Fictibacillus barbaricus]|nr:hypothetical protein GCM10007199_42990 [Fictibacillus barbaricus]